MARCSSSSLPGDAAHELLGTDLDEPVAGSASTGRLRSSGEPVDLRVDGWVSRCPSRARAWRTACSSSPTSGTTRFAASVGVDARRSATSSSSGRSASWPIALTIGVCAAAAARTRPLVAEAEQVLEVAAAAGDHDDVDLRVRVERRERGDHLGTIRSPCTAAWTTRKPTHGQRSCALRITSFSASESLPVIRPMHFGRKGRRRFRERSKRPSAASCVAAARGARAGRRARRASSGRPASRSSRP